MIFKEVHMELIIPVIVIIGFALIAAVFISEIRYVLKEFR